MKKAQSWTIDFILGMLIFLLAGALSIKIITTTNPDDEFRNLFDEGKFISQNLISEGYPENWTNDSFVRIGLLSNGKFNDSKFLNLTKLSLPGVSSKGYYPSKKYLNTRFEYYFYLENEYGRILNFSGYCGFGLNKTKHLPGPNNASYYYTDENHMQNSMFNIFHVPVSDMYSNAQIDTLLSRIDNYTFIFMEKPQLGSFSSLDEYNLTEILQNWTAKGNTLVLTESVGVARIFLNMNFSVPLVVGSATARSDKYFNLVAGTNYVFTDPRTIAPVAPDNYEVIANYSNGPAIATWTYGQGRVIFISDLESAPAITANTETAIAPYVYAFCGPVDLSSFEHKNLVKIVRIFPRGNSIVKLNLYTWPLK